MPQGTLDKSKEYLPAVENYQVLLEIRNGKIYYPPGYVHPTGDVQGSEKDDKVLYRPKEAK